MKVLNFNDPYVDNKGDVNNLGDVLSGTSVDLKDYAKKTDIPKTLPANGGNADTVNNHTVESDVPVDAKFTDTIYDDTEVKGSIAELNESLSVIGKCKNLLNSKLNTSTLNGVTCTANSDGTYALNGTASSDFVFIVNNNLKLDSNISTYRLSGCPSGGNWDSGYSLYVENQYWGVDVGEGAQANLNDANKNCSIYIKI